MTADHGEGDTTGGPGPPFQPPLPLAKRLNRNALTVAAVLMGITVLTAIVLLNPSHEAGAGAGQPGGDRAIPAPSRPAFLDQPVRAPAAWPSDSASSAGRATRPQVETRRGGLADRRGSGPPPRAREGNDPEAAARERTYRAALASSVVLKSDRVVERRPAVTDEAPPPAPTVRAAEPPPPGSPESGGATAGSGGQTWSAATRTTPFPSAAAQRAFLAEAGSVPGRSIAARLEPAGSPFTLRAGTVIPGVLLTAINSELPGDIVGQVARDVYDSRTQRIALIPKGTKLIGTYDNRVVASQERLLVAWTRLILPDGRSMTLPGLALTDPQGRSGAADRVDRHFNRVFGNALLLSAISAGAQLSQPRQGSVFAAPSAGQVAAGAVGQELSSAATQILRRGMDVASTITIRQGQAFNVLLNGDLVFDAPYEPEP